MSANNAPIAEQFAQLLAQVTTLQNKVTALRNQQNQPSTVVFADTPQTLEVKNLIDYGTKRGAKIYKWECAPLNNKSLTNGFNMTPDQIVTFIEALQCRCTEMGWNTGTKIQNKTTSLSTSSRAMAKLTRPPSELPVNASVRLLELTPSHEQSKTTQWWATVWQNHSQLMHKQDFLLTGRTT